MFVEKNQKNKQQTTNNKQQTIKTTKHYEDNIKI